MVKDKLYLAVLDSTRTHTTLKFLLPLMTLILKATP